MKNRTFTLIELIIVLFISGALISLSINEYMDSQKLSKMRIFETNVNEIIKTLNVYKGNQVLRGDLTDSYPTSLSDPQLETFFKQEPKNPYTNKSMLSNNPVESGIQYISDGSSYKLCIVQQDVDDANDNGIINEPLSNLLTIGKGVQTGAAASFARNSPAAMPDDTTFVPANTPRYINNDGILIEDDSVNKIVTEGAWNNDWSKWSHWGNRTYWKNETQYYDETMSATVFQGTATSYTYLYDYYPYTLTSSVTKYAFSIYLKTSTTITRTLKAYFVTNYNDTQVTIGESSKVVTLTPSWQKISWQLTATRADVPDKLKNVGIGIGSIHSVNDIVFYAAKPQFEGLDYASTWTGPNGQRARDNLTTTLYDKIDMTKPWTIETWALPNPEKILTNPNGKDNNSRAVLWQIGSYYMPNQLSITLWKQYPKCIQAIFFDNRDSNTKRISLCLPSNYTSDVPIYTALTYDGNGNYRLYLGSTTFSVSSPLYFTNAYQPSDKFWIGSYDWNAGAWGGTILDLRISNVARSQQELQSNWSNKWPLPVDLQTVYKLSFDGALGSQVGTEMNCFTGN